MSKLRSISKARQSGDILLGALIGMLLLAIIGLGIVYIISRVSISQKDMNVHNLVVGHLRAELQAGNVTQNPLSPLVIGDDTFTLKQHPSAAPYEIEIDIADKTVNVSMHSLSATKKGDSNYIICVGPIPCNN